MARDKLTGAKVDTAPRMSAAPARKSRSILSARRVQLSASMPHTMPCSSGSQVQICYEDIVHVCGTLLPTLDASPPVSPPSAEKIRGALGVGFWSVLDIFPAVTRHHGTFTAFFVRYSATTVVLRGNIFCTGTGHHATLRDGNQP